MPARFLSLFKPPVYDNLERTQKARFLHIALFVGIVTFFLLGYQNRSAANDLDLYLYIMAGICLVSIPFNQHGYYMPVALTISGLSLLVITFGLINGVGLMDAGIISYPIFIIFSSYLISKETVLFSTLLAMISVTVVFFLFRTGYISPGRYSDDNQLYMILILLQAVGFLFWVVVESWEYMLRNLKETYDLTLAGWGQTLEFRDRETQGHSQRVVAMTLALSERLGIRGDRLDAVRWGAQLHDIGKMAIPDGILLKKSRLNQKEWDIVKRHPLDAKAMLEKIHFLKPAMDIPLSHHERWDGSGYPEGLVGETIPLPARIFAVVDVWDALTSDRPYRKAWPKGKALAYIRDQSGILFDSSVVKVFFENIQGGLHSQP